MTRNCCTHRRSRFFGSATFIEKLSYLAGFRQRCCSSKRNSARLRLLSLEQRVVPTLAVAGPFNLLETLTVDADGSTAESETVLEDNRTYTIIVNGDIGLGGGVQADAEYVSFETTPDDGDSSINIGLRIDKVDGVPDPNDKWFGDYCPDHTYRRQIVGTGAKLKAYFQDDNYEGNTGSLNFELYSKLDTQDQDPDTNICSNCVVSIKQAPGTSFQPTPYTQGGVRYADGVIRVNDTDLVSPALNFPFGHGRTWTNDPTIPNCCTTNNGANTIQCEDMSIQSINDDATIKLISNNGQVRYFDDIGGTLTPRHYAKEKLVYDEENNQYILTDTTGQKFRFNDFTGEEKCNKGRLIAYTDPYGNELTINRDADGKITDVSRVFGDVTEEFEYDYYDSGPEQGLLESVTWTQGATTVRSVEYTYHDGTTTAGSAGTLRTVTIKDGAGDPIATTYYRYYMTAAAEGGFNNAMRFAVRQASYDRMMAAFPGASGNPDAVPDPEDVDPGDPSIATFSDFFFEYDSAHRVVRQKVQGAGCSSCFGGIGDYTYAYESAEHGAPDGYNRWATKTTETLADGNQNIVYSNAYGQTMVFLFQEATTGRQWITHTVYDGQGRVVQTANPSSVLQFEIEESLPELMITNGVRVDPTRTEFQVNTYTTSGQGGSSIARDWNGDTVIVWSSYGQDGNKLGVYGQRYNAAHQPVGSEMYISSSRTTGDQKNAVVAMDADGDFVVAWQSYSEDGSGWGIYAQRYSGDGNVAGGVFRVNTTTTHHQTVPSVAMDADGNFVVAWLSYQTSYGDHVYAKLFNADGSVNVGEFAVETSTTYTALAPSAAMDQDGDFIIAWSSYVYGNSYDVLARRYNSAGSAAGSPFTVNSTTAGQQIDAAVAMDLEGDFVIAWTHYNYDVTATYDVYAQRYDSSGSKQGSNFLANSTTTDYQALQSVSMSARGDFVIAWTSKVEESNSPGIMARRFKSDGTPGAAFSVNAYTTNTQSNQAIASDYDGNFVVTWGSVGQDGSGNGVFARPLEQTFSYLSDSEGLVTRIDYGRVTTAKTDGTAGDVAGAVKSVWVQRGELSTPILQSNMQYRLRTDGTDTIWLVASSSIYNDTAGANAQTTTYVYAYSGDILGAYSITTKLPVIDENQNGPDAADERTVVFDSYGRVNWTRDDVDTKGYLTYTEYAPVNGGVVKVIRDVDDTEDDFSDLPSGWETPADGGLHLVTKYVTDTLGRTTQVTDPNGSVTFTVYQDKDHEVRVFPGWDNKHTTAPVQIYREDWGNKYTESLAFASDEDAALLDVVEIPHGKDPSTYEPTGDDNIADFDLQTLSRSHVNDAGQVIGSDAFFDLDGLTYSADPLLGIDIVEGKPVYVNLYHTEYGYDHRGRLTKTVSPTLTITRTNYDGLGRVVNIMVGLDDTPAVGWWSMDNLAGTDLTIVSANVYDNGGIGDSTLTRSIQYPGDAEARTTEYFHNWRDRLVINRSGAVASATSSPTVQFGADTYHVTEAADNKDTYVVLTVSLSAVSSLPVTVQYTVSADSASAGSDYDNPGTVTLLIPAGQMATTTAIKVLADASKESAEKFKVTLASPTNSSLGSTSVSTVTIHDQDDPESKALLLGAPTFTVREGRGTASVVLTQPVPGASFSYKMKVSGGQTSTSGSDFTTYEGTYTFASGETRATFVLPVIDDASVEGTETATLELFDLDGVSISGSSTATVTLIDDDFDPSGEGTSVNRPLGYVEYDNLGRVTLREQFDGDALTISNGGGLPSAPNSKYLRAKQTTSYDDQNRVFRTDTYGVTYDGSSSTVSTYSLYSQAWYNHRGMVMKSAQPGSLSTKTVFDGAGRAIITYISDGGGDDPTGDPDTWDEASNVTGDIVYNESHFRFANRADDGNGTLLVETFRKERFHDASGTGALGDFETEPKARVSFSGMYYDLANRMTDSVNVGTNPDGGGSPVPWDRPSSAPSRSSTVLVSSYEFNEAGWVSITTDPRDFETHTEYDNLGRTVTRIENYVNGKVDSDQEDKTTTFKYDGSGHLTQYQAWLVDGADGGSDPDLQTTGYTYGVSVTDGSYVNSNDILGVEAYPEKNGDAASASAADKNTFDYNALGQRITLTDRNGNVHAYSFDSVGRPTKDAVTTLGSGVEGSVRRMETAYDSAGRAYLFTNYDAATSGNIVNEVQRAFNGLGQLTSEAQGHTSAGAGSAPAVTYAYSEMGSGANHSRLTNIVYPTDLSPDSTLTFNYSGGDDTISRLTSISNDTVTLESYSYLGLGTVVKRVHPQPDVELTYIGSPADAGDQYAGLDRFGRVVDQLWNDGNTITFDRFQYTYDEDGNRLTRDIVMGGSGSSDNYDEKYTYDSLNQLTQFDRGVLSAGSISSPIRRQEWNPDALGNFETVKTTVFGSSTITENRVHNRQNQLESVTITGASTNTLTYDDAGSQTKSVVDDGKSKSTTTFGYDAWNRLVTVNGSSRYAYDPLGRRVKEDTRSFFYSNKWQVLEERNSGALLYRYAWSPVYVDAMISRDKYVTGSFDSRVYVLADANFNVTAIVNTSGTVLERYVYDPYGVFTVVNSSWGSPSSSSSYGWAYLHQGGRWDAGSGMYYFRRRDENPELMKWSTFDPLGYRAGDSNFSRYESGNPIVMLDPRGLLARTCGPDVTDWFRQEITIFSDLAQSAYTTSLWATIFSPAGAFADLLLTVFNLGRLADYKCRKTAGAPSYPSLCSKGTFVPGKPHVPFNTGCPNANPNTVSLCGKCMEISQLGNIIFGVVAFETNTNWESSTFGEFTADWKNNPEKLTAYKIGYELAQLRANGVKADICDVIGHFSPPIEGTGTASTLPPCLDSAGKQVIYSGPNTDPNKSPDVDIFGHCPEKK